MNREQIRAEFDTFIECPTAEKSFVTTTSALLFAEYVVAMAIKAEREACARLCESEWLNEAERMYGNECAAAIRARGQA